MDSDRLDEVIGVHQNLFRLKAGSNCGYLDEEQCKVLFQRTSGTVMKNDKLHLIKFEKADFEKYQVFLIEVF